MPHGTEVSLSPGDIVFRWGPISPFQKGGTAALTFRPMYGGQTAGWIKVTFGTKVGVGPGDVVLDGDPAPPPPKKGGGA